jgi:tetratricopeptide (TPR) repeat protein
MGPWHVTGTIIAATALTVGFAFAQCAFAQDATTVGGDTGSPTVASTIIVAGSVQWARPDDDTPLPSNLRISVDCHGAVSDGGGVSLSGQFRFTLRPDPLAIAADTICTLEAKAFGYESGIGKFPIRSSSGIVNVGTVTLQRNASGDAEDQNKKRTDRTISATSLKAPANAVKLFEHGMRSLRQSKFADAAKDFESAIKIYPDYAEAWLNLGRARVSLHSIGTGRDAFLRAAQLDPQLAEPPEELGLLAAGQNDLEAAARYLDDSLRLDPGHSYRACYSDAVVNMMLKRYDVAERSARAALRFGDTGAQTRVHYVLGMALLATGKNVEAKEQLVRYLELSPKAPEHDQIEHELDRLAQIAASK